MSGRDDRSGVTPRGSRRADARCRRGHGPTGPGPRTAAVQREPSGAARLAVALIRTVASVHCAPVRRAGTSNLRVLGSERDERVHSRGAERSEAVPVRACARRSVGRLPVRLRHRSDLRGVAVHQAGLSRVGVAAAGDHRLAAHRRGGRCDGVRLSRGGDEQEMDEGAVRLHLRRRGALERVRARARPS